MKTVASQIASALQALKNCRASGNTVWEERWEERLAEMIQSLPSGSGLDSGTQLDEENSQPERLILLSAFHHMNDDGCYTRWTSHRIIVTPCFGGIDVRVTGRDHRQIKEYLAEIYHDALSAETVFNYF